MNWKEIRNAAGRACSRLGVYGAEAEDVQQEVCLRTLLEERIEYPRTWAYKVAKGIILNQFRDQKFQGRKSLDELTNREWAILYKDGYTPEIKLSREEQALLQMKLEKVSEAEIAASFGWKPPKVAYRWKLLRRKLREQI